MEENLRKSGIYTAGNMPQGAHFYQSQRTKEDLMDLLILCFKAGMENNGLCTWIMSEFLSVGEAKEGSP